MAPDLDSQLVQRPGPVTEIWGLDGSGKRRQPWSGSGCEGRHAPSSPTITNTAAVFDSSHQINQSIQEFGFGRGSTASGCHLQLPRFPMASNHRPHFMAYSLAMHSMRPKIHRSQYLPILTFAADAAQIQPIRWIPRSRSVGAAPSWSLSCRALAWQDGRVF